jgi:O-antigen/teichoic acid export membrane protein
MSIAVMVVLPNLIGLAVRGIAMGHGFWGLAARERYLTALIRVTGIFTLFFLDWLTVASATLVISLSSVAGAFVYLGMLRNGWKGTSLTRSKHRLRETVTRAEYMGYANRIWIGIAGGAILSRVSQVLMPAVSTVEQLGIFVVAVNIADASIVISIAIRDVVFAESAREGGVERLCKAARFSLVLTTAFGGAAIASSPLWLTLIFGSEFEGAFVPMIILLAAFALGTPGSIAGAGLSSIGRPGLRSVAVVIGAVINVLLLFVVAGPFGAVGASLATLVANLVCALTVTAMYVRLTEATWKKLYLPTRSDFVAGAQILARLLHDRSVRLRTRR